MHQARFGSGISDDGEDCTSCPADYISGSGGTPDACWKYDGICHPKKEDSACSDCAPGYCCGDGSCEGGEDVENCAIDCGCSSDAECNDNELCTVDVCDPHTGGCVNTWATCGLDDGCCGPDGASQCVASSTCNCNSKCGKKENNATCPWDCPWATRTSAKLGDIPLF